MEYSAEFKTTVRQSLVGYWRWVAEGRRKEQHYYDPYHSYIDYDPALDVYSFRIQTFDSPDGDIWESGTFRWKYGEIAELKSETRNN